MKTAEIVAKNIRKYREKNNLSIAEFSKLCNVSARQLAAIENQTSNARLDTIDKISAAMGIPSGYLAMFEI